MSWRRYLCLLPAFVGALTICQVGVCEQMPAESSINAAPLPAGAVNDLLRRSREREGSNSRQALLDAQQALEGARRQRDRPAELRALLQVGRVCRIMIDYAGANAAAREGLALTGADRDDPMRGEFLQLIGTIQWNQADLSNATANLLEALRIGEALDNKTLQCNAHNILGLVRSRYDDAEGSLEHLEAARRLAEELGEPLGLASVLNNLGDHYLDAKNYPLARSFLERALALLQNANDERLRSFVLINLGQTATETGNQPLAGNYLAEAMAICERDNLQRGAADVHYLLAVRERRLGRMTEAMAELRQSLSIAETLGHPDLFAILYEECVLVEEALGDYRAALEYSRKLAAQTEIIRGEKSQRVAAEIEGRYEAEARSRKIKLLQREKELQATELELINADLSRARNKAFALAAVLGLSGLAGATLISRQRSRARAARHILAETRAAKELAEEADALKARLLTVAAQNLDESETRFRNAFEHSALGFALVSPEGRWLRVNQALCSITGYNAAEMLATDFQRITHPDDLEADLDLVARLLRGEIDSYHLEKRFFHKQGHVVWIDLNVSLMRDPATGQPRYFISQLQDITGRKRSEQALRAAKEEAERSNNAKSEFLSRVSHELRTPLNAILGFGQLLETQDLGARNNQGIEHILAAGRHLLGLIDEVLDISRIESGDLALSFGAVSVDAMTRETLDLVRPLAEQAGVRLTVDLENEAVGSVRADARRLKQVLLNLLSNAIKFNHPGGEVILRRRRGEEDRLRIEIADTGPGISSEDLTKIFSPFARLPTAQGIEGTGLGLSLSKALTEAMQGKLGVDSEPGKGSIFWVEFARTESSEAALTDADISALAFNLGLFASPGATALYIEDNLANLQVVEHFLASEGDVRLLTAMRGSRGLEIAREQRPDLILLDLHLPDMPGEEVLRALRQTPETAAIPVIVISADATPGMIRRLRELGACEYLVKPLNLQEFRRTIDRVLQTGAAV